MRPLGLVILLALASCGTEEKPPWLEPPASPVCHDTGGDCAYESLETAERDNLKVRIRKVEGARLTAAVLGTALPPSGRDRLLAAVAMRAFGWTALRPRLAALGASVSAGIAREHSYVVVSAPTPHFQEALFHTLDILSSRAFADRMEASLQSFEIAARALRDDPSTAVEAHASVLHEGWSDTLGFVARELRDSRDAFSSYDERWTLFDEWSRIRNLEPPILAIVGDVDTLALQRRFEARRSPWPLSPTSALHEDRLLEPPSFTAVEGVLTTHVAGLFDAPPARQDDAAAFALALIMLEERLHVRLRLELGIVYSVYAHLAFGRRGIARLGFSTDHPRRALDEIRAVLQQIAAQGFSDDEVLRAQNRWRTAALVADLRGSGLEPLQQPVHDRNAPPARGALAADRPADQCWRGRCPAWVCSGRATLGHRAARGRRDRGSRADPATKVSSNDESTPAQNNGRRATVIVFHDFFPTPAAGRVLRSWHQGHSSSPPWPSSASRR
jgi:predicted Zn-dependent peptidase